MDLKSISRRVAALAARTPPRRLHPGLVVVFRSCDGDGKPAPLPDVPHRHPEPRDPSRGLDVVWVGEDGAELRCV
jgi:hypothetical protein